MQAYINYLVSSEELLVTVKSRDGMAIPVVEQEEISYGQRHVITIKPVVA
jgi:hypothetical protein